MNEILNFEFLTNQDNKRLTEFINKSQKLCYEKGLLTEKEIQFSLCEFLLNDTVFKNRAFDIYTNINLNELKEI
ncbi:hypothetical protein JTZ62_04545 [Mammaliicoccus sciuri]|uniref:hypothetical protein n=1 Tax=Mammaliicoccus sciuri TaxID=1296 RepID=UPI0019D407DD|nr:hypothetical protein [Mammaliicoccus sciuri]QSN68427.1 hypothetical protein JTZ62_04545 [Mammaliicoccus sciuri]UIU23168.1 hypothetical protein LLZ87_04555 [Mammaliicoccus sciuri]UIU26073.1 hypothetical protein LLZ92_04555 [Mammaliicoccus sciuri]